MKQSIRSLGESIFLLVILLVFDSVAKASEYQFAETNLFDCCCIKMLRLVDDNPEKPLVQVSVDIDGGVIANRFKKTDWVQVGCISESLRTAIVGWGPFGDNRPTNTIKMVLSPSGVNEWSFFFEFQTEDSHDHTEIPFNSVFCFDNMSPMIANKNGEIVAAPSQPDLCVVLVDSLRPDHLGCYGYERDTSPAIDAFAAGAVRFDQAIASGSWTQPSIMSMMTSVPADVHQRVHWGRPHSTNVVTLAETLQKAGYQTVGLVANPMTNRKYGFARGFDFYDDYSLTGAPDATTGDIARQTAQGAKLTRIAQDWIERRRDPEKPLFLFVLYIDVHWDYLPPPPFNRMFAPDPVPPPRDIWNLGRKSVPEAARRRSVAAYDGEIRYTDGCISNLLAAIEASPRGKDTVVVFCSDHGESFWERGVASHGNALHEEELRVPLVIRPARGDGEPAPPRVVSEQVSLIDLAPTLADLAGVPAPTNWVGRSLAPALRGETLPEVPVVLDNRIGDDGAVLRGVRTSRWKVVAGPPHDRPDELYDLRADPAETNNLLRAGGFALPPEVEALVPLLKPVR